MQVIKATPIEIDKSARTSDVFRDIMEVCLRHASANATLIDPANPDAVHQTRVGLRRARSALALFKPHVRASISKQLAEGYREVGRKLGPCRDWDVFIRETLPKFDKHWPEINLHVIAENHRAQAYAAVCNEMGDTLTRIAEFVPGMDFGQTIDPIGIIAPDLLDRVHLRVRRAVRHTKTSDDRHTLRKRIKRLRYSIEFLSSLFDGHEVKDYLDHCKEAQGVLGRMNDASTIIHLINQLDTGKARKSMLEWAEHIQEKAAGHLGHAITALRAAKPFWD